MPGPRKVNGRGYRRYRRFRRRFRKRRSAKMSYASYLPPKGNRVGKLISGGRTNAATTLAGFPNNRVFTSKFYGSWKLTANNTIADEPYTVVFDMTDIRYPLVRVDTDFAEGYTSNAWNSWRAFYNQYVVIGCTANITFSFAQTPEDADAMIVGAQLNNNFDVLASNFQVRDLIQNRKCKWTQMASSIASGVYRMSIKYDAKKWHSLSDVADADQLLILFDQTISEDQSERLGDAVYLRVFATIFNGEGVAQSCTASVDLTYTVLASDPKTLPASQNTPWPPPES